MENRSFDHFLGWLPGSDGKQAGLTFNDRSDHPHPTFDLRGDFQGCKNSDPDHSYGGGREEYDEGKCDGWLRAGDNDEYAIGYYGRSALPFFNKAAGDWTVCDSYFAAIMAETFPNRIYQHAAQTDRLANKFTICNLPTIWDPLLEAGVTAGYYYSDVPFLALWGSRYTRFARPFAAFLGDCLLGTLPHVAFVDPPFIDENLGTSTDDHPHADVRRGQAFLHLIYEAVTHSRSWKNTVLVMTYDEWGGFFDHVPPPTAPIPPATSTAGDRDGRLGFRVPCLVVSPFARRNHVAHSPSYEYPVVYDHTSILKMIEWRWGLKPLTDRDSQARSMVDMLDLSAPNTAAPRYCLPAPPFPKPCFPAARAEEPSEANKWSTLGRMAMANGWPLWTSAF